MYVNSYLDEVGRLINLCMEYVKTNHGYDEIEDLSSQLREPEIIYDMFKQDVQNIVSKYNNNQASEKDVKDNFDRLRVYVLTQLHKHYDLVNRLLGDTEKKVDVSFTKDDREFPKRLKEDVMEIIDEADKDLSKES
ncbi:MAG: hypothetical protein ACLFVX_04550 [Archaeoglobaceae archaeon]